VGRRKERALTVSARNKNLNDALDDILAGLDLPTDAEVREETGKVKRAEGVRANRHKISESGKRAYQDPARLEKQKKAMNNRDNTSHAAAGKKRAADPLWKENHSKGIEALRNDPERWAEYQENYKKGNTEKYNNPEFWNNYYAAIQERDSKPEYHKKRLNASKNKIRKPVRTPLGVFETQTDAMKAHGFKNTEIVRHRCKSDTFPDWQMISIEEYEKYK
jgi:hypothetical protein